MRNVLIAVMMVAAIAAAEDFTTTEPGTNNPPVETYDRLVVDNNSVKINWGAKTYKANCWFVSVSQEERVTDGEDGEGNPILVTNIVTVTTPASVTIDPNADGVELYRGRGHQRMHITVTDAEQRAGAAKAWQDAGQPDINTPMLMQNVFLRGLKRAIMDKAKAAIKSDG